MSQPDRGTSGSTTEGDAAFAARWTECLAPARRKGFQVMGTRLYVGNLPFDVDEAQLRTLFQEGGREVTEVKMITDRETGRPRGFAFVEMASQEHAQAAINAMNGKEVGGRALTVNEAREQAPRGGGGGGYRSGGGGGYGGGRRGY
jgi:cold-inducible RNA-binding protein